DLTASLSSVRLHRHIGEGGSCDPCYPLDQPPTSDPQPVVLADTGTDARENIGSSPHRIYCLAPLLTGLSKGVRDMREPSKPGRSVEPPVGAEANRNPIHCVRGFAALMFLPHRVPMPRPAHALRIGQIIAGELTLGWLDHLWRAQKGEALRPRGWYTHRHSP